jgi:AbrB family looped-hinge helix DNA binding protein
MRIFTLTARGKNMRITSKGQVTIPQVIREAAGLLPHTEVEFTIDGDVVTIARAKSTGEPRRGKRLVDLLLNAATANHDISTDEILDWSRSEPLPTIGN